VGEHVEVLLRGVEHGERARSEQPAQRCEVTGERIDEHDLLGLDCWCSPRYLLPCDECDVEIAPADDATEQIFERGSGCWKCDDGCIPLSRAEAEATERSIIIVHNR